MMNKVTFIKIACLFGLLILISTCMNAQHRITGTVTSSFDGEPLIGAFISEIGTSNGTTTDLDGSYELEVAGPNATLRFQYIGYTEQDLEVDGRNEINVILSEGSVLIDQVIVVGYGVQKKSDLTGSVSSIQGAEIQRGISPNVEQALQGKIAGVYVTPANGQPGQGATIRIRGTGTLNNSNPLYVIDGMITEDATSVNPQDVQSIEVLKDASAAAIYGSRGANGVILITTKKGVAGDGKLSLSATFGQQDVIRTIPLLTGAEFARAYNQLRNQNHFTNPDSLGVGTDWQSEIFRTAPIMNLQFGASGGSENMVYNFSVNYFDQDGVIKNSSFTRGTFRFNTEMKLKPWFSVGTNTSYSIVKEQLGPNVVNLAYRMPPVLSAYNSAGNFTDPTFYGLAVGNPAADLFYKSDRFKDGSVLLGNMYGEISILKNLKFRSNFGYNVRNSEERYFEPIYNVSASQLNRADRVNVNLNQDANNWIWEQTLNYYNEWEDHTLGVLVGYTAEERKSKGLGASREGFPGTASELLYLSSGNDTTQMNSEFASDEALNSLLFRTNYSFLDKYLFTASMRVDKSSRFTPDNRTGYFPSASIGWNASREQFIQDLNIFDRLKMRLSYGILGNQALTNRYPTSAIINGNLGAVFGPGESLDQGATQLSISNPNLKWEVSNQIDIGMEAGFLDDKLSFEVDWYSRRTYDIIAAVPIPDYVGSSSDPFVNTAEVINKGWDISANWRQSGTVDFNFGVILSPVSNKVLALAKGRSEIFDAEINGEPATHTIVGLPIGAFYGYQVAGVFQNEEEIASSPKLGGEKPGDLRYADTNGDGVVNGSDRVYLGSPIPTLTYGFNAAVGFKGLTLNLDFFGVHGNKVFNEKEAFRFGVYNWEKHVADAWTTENPSTEEPRVTNGGHNYRVSDRFIQDGSFFRLRTINLGYDLPSNILNRIKMDGVRIYITGSNLWTLQKYTGYTPEFPNSSSPFKVGFDNGVYPIAKSIQIGFDTFF